jgi:hypothetical protein|tara:strand:+ start:136 stop:654 length:519 start_codon:yes stop_codon:yes gene_type:complete
MSKDRFLPLPPYLRLLFNVPSVANAEISSQTTLMSSEKDKKKNKKKDVEPRNTDPEPPKDPQTNLPLDILSQLLDIAKEVDKTLPEDKRTFEENKPTTIEVKVEEKDNKAPVIEYKVGEQGTFLGELEESNELLQKLKEAMDMLEYFESKGLTDEAKKIKKDIKEFKKRNNL